MQRSIDIVLHRCEPKVDLSARKVTIKPTRGSTPTLVKIMSNPVILIVEDDPFIATDISMALSKAGYKRLVLIPSIDLALDFLTTVTPSLAIVDINLDDGHCVDVARILVDRKVPFVVSSGLRTADVDPIFQAGIWAPKPITAEDLLQHARSALLLGNADAHL